METPHREGMTPQEAQFQNYTAMMSVVHQMKEIPELPSEKPSDVSALLKVEFPDEGGVLTYMEGQLVPYRGFPFSDMVEKTDVLKKVMRGLLSSFFHSIKRRNKLQLLCLAFVPWLIKDSVKALIYVVYRTVERFRIKPKMYSKAMRELHRVFSLEIPGESESQAELRKQLRDAVCMILEFDNAYRFRFQDIVAELDKSALSKSPSKELLRLFSLMQSRETGQSVKDTWSLAKFFLPGLLFLSPRLKQSVVHILSNLVLEDVALTIEDKHYCVPRKDYAFGFVTNLKDAELVGKVRAHMARKEAQARIREESTKAHEEMFARHLQEFPNHEELNRTIAIAIQDETIRLNNEGNRALEAFRQKTLEANLTDEQRAILERHKEENRELDILYNSKLQALDS